MGGLTIIFEDILKFLKVTQKFFLAILQIDPSQQLAVPFDGIDGIIQLFFQDLFFHFFIFYVDFCAVRFFHFFQVRNIINRNVQLSGSLNFEWNYAKWENASVQLDMIETPKELKCLIELDARLILYE